MSRFSQREIALLVAVVLVLLYLAFVGGSIVLFGSGGQAAPTADVVDPVVTANVNPGPTAVAIDPTTGGEPTASVGIATTPGATTDTGAGDGPDEPAVDEVSAGIQRALGSLERGQIVYNPPQRMRVGATERVVVRIAFDTLVESVPITASVPGGGPLSVEAIPVTTLMQVRMLGDEQLEVNALSNENQPVVPGDFTQWAWDITPRAAGTRKLSIVVTARVQLPGYPEERKDLQVLDREIAVEVDPLYSLTSFVGQNTLWLAPSLAAALGLLGYSVARARRTRALARASAQQLALRHEAIERELRALLPAQLQHEAARLAAALLSVASQQLEGGQARRLLDEIPGGDHIEIGDVSNAKGVAVGNQASVITIENVQITVHSDPVSPRPGER
jgi:hypothetical protein